MSIPFLYDVAWFFAPALWVFLVAVVAITELRAQRHGHKIAFWVAIQLFLPFIGFLAWLWARWARKQKKH